MYRYSRQILGGWPLTRNFYNYEIKNDQRQINSSYIDFSLFILYKDGTTRRKIEDS